MRTHRTLLIGTVLAIGLSWTIGAPGRAEEVGGAKAEEGAMVDGAGFTMFGTESIKGSDTSKLEKDPVCDRSRRPAISKVEPDEAKPGDKVTIKGENFGSKECFHGVTFSAAPKEKIDYHFLNDTTIEAVVPDAKAGMSFVIVVAGGGSAQSKPVLIQAK